MAQAPGADILSQAYPVSLLLPRQQVKSLLLLTLVHAGPQGPKAVKRLVSALKEPLGRQMVGSHLLLLSTSARGLATSVVKP